LLLCARDPTLFPYSTLFRSVGVAVGAALLVALVIGLATVLIPNPIFARDIPPTWWSYPVWLLTSALTGMLVATYVAPVGEPAPRSEEHTSELQSRFDLVCRL